MRLQKLCRTHAGYCAIDHHRALHSLTPYNHLARIYWYCMVHFIRNITALCHHVSLMVRKAMISLASVEPLPDFEGTLNVIRAGGKKASGKLHHSWRNWINYVLFRLAKRQRDVFPVCHPSAVPTCEQDPP